MYTKLPWHVVLLLLLLPLAGCGGELTNLHGTVTLDGQPLASGTVVFTGSDKAAATGDIASDGSYTARTGSLEGIRPGKYRVTVSAFRTRQVAGGTPMPEFLTPVRYNRAETSGLEVEVPPGGREYNIALTSE